ncbi:MAG: trigger factor [Candidatus Latescibacterota bacterium]
MLKVSIDGLDGVRSRINVEASPQRVEEEVSTVARKYRRELQVPGFRKGKVPMGLIRTRFREALESELLSECVPMLYQEAIDQEGLVPLAHAEIEDVEYESGNPLRFAALVELKPEIEVIGYDDLCATRTVRKVREEQVDQWLNHQRERHAQITMVDRAAAIGDIILVDLRQTDRGGIPIVGEQVADQHIELGAGHHLGDAFDQQMVGAEKGGERRVELAIPGKDPVFFSVNVKEIHEKALPDLNDDFAKDMGFDSLPELREKIGALIQSRMDDDSERGVHSELINQMISKNTFDAPQTMVENYMQSLLAEVKKRSKEKVNEEMLREQERGNAIRHIKTHLILQGIVRTAPIEVPDEDIDDQIRKIAEGSKTDFEELRAAMKADGRWEHMRSDLQEKRAMDFLVDRADIAEVDAQERNSGLIVPPSMDDDYSAETILEEISLTE